MSGSSGGMSTITILIFSIGILCTCLTSLCAWMKAVFPVIVVLILFLPLKNHHHRAPF